MRLRKRFLVAVFLSVFMNGCATFDTQRNARRQFSLQNVEKIQPGISHKEDVLAILGPPDEKPTGIFEEGTGAPINAEFWSYLEEPYQASVRVSIEFPLNSDIVQEIGWDVREGEPEKNLNTALAHFPGANFNQRKKASYNPHSGSYESYYEDKKLGIIVLHNDAIDQVESISWFDPKAPPRNVAAEYRCPEYCMQGHCTSICNRAKFSTPD